MITIHTHSSEGSGSVNSFAVETESALIAVDAQRQISEAKKFLGALQKTGKPVTALLLTHEHPDHNGGLSAYQAAFGSDLPVYLTRATQDAIEADAFGFLKLAAGILKDDFSLPPRANHYVEDGQILEFGELKIQVHDLGAGESASMSAFEVLGAASLICGDVVANRMTPFFFEGRSGLWMDQLEKFHQRFPHIEMLYCGHGAPGPAATLVADQLQYLQRFRALVAQAQKGGALTEDDITSIRLATEAAYPGYLPVAEIPSFIELNAAAVARELFEQESK